MVTTAVCFCCWTGAAQTVEPYDLWIRGGKVVDGTGNPWFRGDVAVRGDRIVAIGRVPKGPAKREIDARGLVVAPGFIDIHSHSDYLLVADGDAQSKVRQGVTTEVLGEGHSVAPYKGKLEPRSMRVEGGKKVQWRTLEEYFRILESAGASVNVASYVGLNNVWEAAMGKSFEPPTIENLEQMKMLVDEAMRHGAFGLSSQVMMPPGSLATVEHIVALCEVVAGYGGIFSIHIRNEGTGVFDSVKEAIGVGRNAGIRMDIIHLKIADQQYWGRMDEVVELIEQARREGIDVQANVYPYTRGNNNLVSIIPPWAHEGGHTKLLARLKDPRQREKMKHDIIHGVPGWYNHYTAVGGDWARMLISGNNRFKGWTMDRVMAQRTEGKSSPDLLEELFDFLLEEGGSVGTVYSHHTERDMNLALVQPWCSVGSDGSSLAVEGPLRLGHPHPRNFGTFPRLLGVYVRERKLLRLEDAVRKATSLNASKLGIPDRGILRTGMFADITVFDAEKVIDGASYVEPFHYNDGIEYVIVNGELVLEGKQHSGARPGRPLRRQ